jgi:hypothetical protein
MIGQTRGYLTVTDIIRIYAVKRSYVYRLAHRDQWGRYRHPDGTVRYRYEHVDNSLAPGGSLRWQRKVQTRP